MIRSWLFPADMLQQALENDLSAGLSAVLAATHPFKRLAAAQALADFLRLHPEQVFPTFDYLLRYPQEQAKNNVQRLLTELSGLESTAGLTDWLARALTAPLRQAMPKTLQNLAKIYYAWLLADAPTQQDLIVLLSANLQVLAACMWGELGQPPGDACVGAAQAQTRSAHLWLEVCQGLRTWKCFLEYETAQDLARSPEQMAWLDECSAPLRPDVLQTLASLGQAGRAIDNWLVASNPHSRRQALERAQDWLDKVAACSLPTPEHTLARAVVQRWRQIIAGAQA